MPKRLNKPAERSPQSSMAQPSPERGKPFSQRNKIKILLRWVVRVARSFYDKSSGCIRQVLCKLSTKFRTRHPRDDEWA